MAISVQHGDENETTYRHGIKWVVDDAERLHIIGPDGNIASYNRGYWANVKHVALTEA